MVQGKQKFKKAKVEVKKTKMQIRKKKGRTSEGPKKHSLAHKLNTKLTAEIGRNIEKSVTAKYSQGGGSLSILKQND